ncbi:MAG TPA: twin-arginine translocase TatA/TatE family subunit [Bacteroidales bacterium]|nr:twin-arginine translocase TatA/TatE family subunit [Bacteroidales bacterium]
MDALVILGMFGPTEIIIIVLIVVLLFGGRKIPELMRGIGQGMKEFKNATKDDQKNENKKSETTEKSEIDKE